MRPLSAPAPCPARVLRPVCAAPSEAGGPSPRRPREGVRSVRDHTHSWCLTFVLLPLRLRPVPGRRGAPSVGFDPPASPRRRRDSGQAAVTSPQRACRGPERLRPDATLSSSPTHVPQATRTSPLLPCARGTCSAPSARALVKRQRTCSVPREALCDPRGHVPSAALPRGPSSVALSTLRSPRVLMLLTCRPHRPESSAEAGTTCVSFGAWPSLLARCPAHSRCSVRG